MKVLSDFECAVVSGGMGNGATQQGVYPKAATSSSNQGCNNGVVGGAVAGFLGALASANLLGAVAVIGGAVFGGAISGGCFDSNSGGGGGARNKPTPVDAH